MVNKILGFLLAMVTLLMATVLVSATIHGSFAGYDGTPALCWAGLIVFVRMAGSLL